MRFLHTMLRVGNLDESIRFYTEILGMKVISKQDYPDGKFTLAFLSYGSDKYQDVSIELTYNWGKDSYVLGDAFGHVAIGVQDIYKTCEKIKKLGGKITREPGPMKHGKTVIAFIEDPNGYKIELIETREDHYDLR
jgi:lactoylglutathione lyase